MAPVFPVSDGDYTGMVYVEKIEQNVYRLLNNSGASVAQGDYLLFNGMFGVVLQDAANTEHFDFQIDDQIELQANDLDATYNTFATLYQTVYFNAANGVFSDDPASGVPVGKLSQVKDADGCIKFLNFRKTDLDSSGAAIVEFEISADASSGVVYDPGFDFKLLDMVVYSTASVALATVTASDGTNNISDAIDIATANTRAVPATLDETYNTIEGTEALTFTTNSAADRCRIIMTIKAV
jgi:hypothetical protein